MMSYEAITLYNDYKLHIIKYIYVNSLQSNLIAYSEMERGLLAYSSRSTDSHAKNKTKEKTTKLNSNSLVPPCTHLCGNIQSFSFLSASGVLLQFFFLSSGRGRKQL